MNEKFNLYQVAKRQKPPLKCMEFQPKCIGWSSPLNTPNELSCSHESKVDEVHLCSYDNLRGAFLPPF